MNEQILKLRDYQEEAIKAVSAEFKKGYNRTLVVLPTGTGKTIVFSKVAEEKVRVGENVLILAHRGELLDQARDKLRFASGLDAALEKAEFTAIGI